MSSSLLYTTISSDHCIYLWDLQGTTVAFNRSIGQCGVASYSDASGSLAGFNLPTGIVVDPISDGLYIADFGNHAIRFYDPVTDQVVTVAGHPDRRSSWDGPLADAEFDGPAELALSTNGELVIADTSAGRVRRVVPGPSGLLDMAAYVETVATLDAPSGLDFDAYGNLWVNAHDQVKIYGPTGASQVVFGLGGTSLEGFTKCLSGLAIHADESVWLTDRCTGNLIQLQRQ